jgi:phosphotransferase system enzyme I (PtsI)
MGLTDFSMHFSQLLLVKREILKADVSKLRAATAAVLSAIDPAEQADALAALAAA